MYNSQNLPLSPRKVAKKFIARYGGVLVFLILLIIVISTGFVSYEPATVAFISAPLTLWFLIGFIYEYLYYRLYYYNFENDSAEIRKGVISRATGHVRYDRLQNIYVDQDVLDRVFGLYDVHYETAGERSGFYSHVDGLRKENAGKLVNFLKERIEGGVASSVQNKNSDQAVTAGKVIARSNCPVEPRVIFSSTLGGFLVIFISIAVVGVILNLIYHMPLTPAAIAWTAAIVIFITLIYSIIWYKNFYFSFGAERGEIRSSVIATSASFLAYDRIQNVNVHQGIIDRVLGIYSVIIETAGETSGFKFVIYGLNSKNSEILKNFLLDRARAYKKI